MLQIIINQVDFNDQENKIVVNKAPQNNCSSLRLLWGNSRGLTILTSNGYICQFDSVRIGVVCVG